MIQKLPTSKSDSYGQIKEDEYLAECSEIGAHSFSRTGIKRIVIPEGVKEIENNAFSGCSNLEEVKLPTTLRKIGSYAFGFSKIKSIIIPEEVETIKYAAFFGCSNLEEVKLPTTLKKIGSSAFYDSGIKRIVIPEGVEEIESEAFKNCLDLEEIKLPTTLIKIDSKAFLNSGIKRIVIPEGAEEIESEAFCFCSNLEEVILPATLKKIDSRVFHNSGIKRIVIPEGVEEIKSEAFSDCSNLEEITLSSAIKSIENDAFDNSKIIKINITSSLEYGSLAVHYFVRDILYSRHIQIGKGNISLSFLFNYEDKAMVKEFSSLYYSDDCKQSLKKLKEEMPYIKEKYGSLNVCLIGPDLSFSLKCKLKKLFSKVGIKSCTFLPEVNNPATLLNLVYSDDYNNDNEILLRIKKIDTLIAKYPEKTKSFVMKKREGFIHKYKEEMQDEKPTLDFSSDTKTSFGKVEIGFSKVKFLAELDSFIQILSNEMDFSFKLKKYYKILESPEIIMVENPSTTEEIINNLVSLFPLLEENKKEEVLQKIKTNLEDMRKYYEQSIEERINLHLDFETILYDTLNNLYKDTLIYYAYYKQSKPYINLKQSFLGHLNEPSTRVELMIFNFLESLNTINHQKNANELKDSFEEVKNKYTRIIDYILEKEEFQEENYCKVVGQLIIDMEPLLKYMNIVLFQEKKQVTLQTEIQEELRNLHHEEVEFSIQRILRSFIIDIENVMKENQLEEEDIEQIESKIERVLNFFLNEMNFSEIKGQMSRIELELYKEMAGIFFTIKSYVKNKNSYNTLNLIK